MSTADDFGGRALVRSTRQRLAIAEVLSKSERFLSAQELFEEIRATGRRVGLATVYRTLQSLADEGQLDTLRNAQGEIVYRKCERVRHHHHIVCTSCGLSIEVESAEIERWMALAARRHGFTATSHVAELYGLCDRCS